MTPTRLKEIKDLCEKVGFNSNGFTITLTNALDVGSILNAVPELIEALEKANELHLGAEPPYYRIWQSSQKQIEILRRGLEILANHKRPPIPSTLVESIARQTLAEADEVGK